jgi:hypothetical protein
METSGPRERERPDLTAMLRFTESGVLKEIYLCVSTDQDQKILEGAIEGITNPKHWGWFRKLLRRG